MKKKKTILVTGGAGFIGSHLCERLLKIGNKVYLLDRFKNSKNIKRKEKNITGFKTDKNLTLIDTDILAKDKVTTIFKTHSINTVVHLAAQADVTFSIANPAETLKTNLLGSTIIFEAAAKYGISHIIYTSSSLVYGKNAKLPMKENAVCNYPTSPYAASMRAIELAAHARFAYRAIQITGLRLFPVYGPRMRENLVIPVLVDRISQDKPVNILGDSKQKRSFCYIDDIVDGIIAAIEKPPDCQLINLGHSTPITLISLITLIEKILSKNSNRRYLPPRSEDIAFLYPDISKAKSLLNFSPKIPLEEGLLRYINWHKISKKNG